MYNKLAILCSGGSLKNLNKLPKNIEYVILINYFWADDKNSSEDLWKNEIVYNFLKNKKIILFTREINGNIKDIINNLNIVEAWYSRWSYKLCNEYKWLKSKEHIYTRKKLRFSKQESYNVCGLQFKILPNKIFKYCKDELILYNLSYLMCEKTNFSDVSYKRFWLSTLGHAIDLSVNNYHTKDIYIIGWDCYEGGSLNKQIVGVDQDITWKGLQCRKQYINGIKSSLLNKVKTYSDVKFNLYTFANFNLPIVNTFEADKINYDLELFKNFKLH